MLLIIVLLYTYTNELSDIFIIINNELTFAKLKIVEILSLTNDQINLIIQEPLLIMSPYFTELLYNIYDGYYVNIQIIKYFFFQRNLSRKFT